MGVHFASFLLEIVEGNNPEILVDMVIALILAFNQQFSEHTVNVIIEAMQNLPTAKVFTEKLLLLLNREGNLIACINSIHIYTYIYIHSIPCLFLRWSNATAKASQWAYEHGAAHVYWHIQPSGYGRNVLHERYQGAHRYCGASTVRLGCGQCGK